MTAIEGLSLRHSRVANTGVAGHVGPRLIVNEMWGGGFKIASEQRMDK